MRRPLWLVVTLVIAACVGPPPRDPDATRPQTTLVQQRITAATLSAPSVLYAKLEAQGLAGSDALQDLVNAGLAVEDYRGRPQARLAEQIPSLENGLWTLSADGRMDVTYRIKSGARWHDGAPFTTDDLLFTSAVAQDKELAPLRDAVFDMVASITAPDPRTITVSWTTPYILADRVFTTSKGRVPPLPKHLLEKAYAEDKATFTQLPYWSEEFVGTGPYKAREFVRGSHVVLEANESYALGRPKIDRIELKFISDAGALMAALLAGTVDLTLGRSLTVAQAIDVRDQWRDGRMDTGSTGRIMLVPQFINPHPAVVGDLQFRRALLYALDRKQMAETFESGLSSVADGILNPNSPEYAATQSSVARYEHDPRKATQMIEALGYTRSSDGVFRDAASQKLSIEIRRISEATEPTQLAVANSWQVLGIETETVAVPQQRLTEFEYRWTWPGFYIYGLENDLVTLSRFHSRNTPLPENNFRVTGNHSRYLSPQLDSLIDRFFSTIPEHERMQALGEIVHHISDQLPLIGLYYRTEPTLIANKLGNVTARNESATQSWNAHEWIVR